jgi:hypothetical protein
MRAFEDNIILHHSLEMPIITMVPSIEAYTLNPFGTRQTLATMLVPMHPTNQMFQAKHLLPPLMTRYLVLPRGTSVTP